MLEGRLGKRGDNAGIDEVRVARQQQFDDDLLGVI